MKKALGKGLDALFSVEDVSVSDSRNRSLVEYVGLDKIDRNPNQPRKSIDNEEIDELSLSIKSKGVIQPIIVTEKDERYMIVAGERRYLAAKKAGLEKMPVIIRELSDEDIMEIALVENIQRSNLNAMEEAMAFLHLVEKYNITHEDLAQRLGKSRVYITNTCRILKLPMSIKSKIMDGKISKGHAVALLQVEDEDKIKELADRIEKEQLSVREVERLVVTETKTSKKKGKNPGVFLTSIEEKLTYKYNTKVHVQGTLDKGKIIIEYYSKDQLDKFLEM